MTHISDLIAFLKCFVAHKIIFVQLSFFSYYFSTLLTEV